MTVVGRKASFPPGYVGPGPACPGEADGFGCEKGRLRLWSLVWSRQVLECRLRKAGEEL